MRKEAALEEWEKLYETATRIKAGKPWDKFWDMDIIGITRGNEEDTVFFSILGRGGDCYGVSVYEGFEGLNTFLMLAMQQSMNVSSEFAMYHQKNLSCYWGNREELSNAQRKTIKDLGYKYRGKNQWLYFMSFEPGYYPYNLDKDEVLRMSQYMHDLELALTYYQENTISVAFENGNMFHVILDDKDNVVIGREEPLPFVTFQFGSLCLDDEELLSELKNVPQCDAVLEADVSAPGMPVADKKYDRPANMALALLGDANSGMMLKFEMVHPEEDGVVMLAEILIGFIFQFGTPQEVRVSNVVIEAGLSQICDVCGIKLRPVKRLRGLDEFVEGLYRFI